MSFPSSHHQPISPSNPGEATFARAKCAFYFNIQHQSGEGVRKLGPAGESMIRSYAGVSSPFRQQIGDIHLARQCIQADIPVLILYGTADSVPSASERYYLVDTIKSFHTGRTIDFELTKLGRDFGTYASPAEFMNRRVDSKQHPFDSDFLTAILTWLRQNSSTSGQLLNSQKPASSPQWTAFLTSLPRTPAWRAQIPLAPR